MERWIAIKNYEGLYEVSSFGRVRSLPRNTTSGRVLKLNKSRFYMSVCLSKENKFQTFAVHRLVACHFIENPEHKPVVNHLDGNKYNNEARNLEWCTHSENKLHAIKNGFTHSPRGAKHWAAKLSEKDVIRIRQQRHLPLKELSKKYGISMQNISDIINRKRWKHV